MFSGAFAEKVGTKAEKKKGRRRGRRKKETMFPPSPSLGNSCYEAIFSYDLGKSTSNDVGIGLTSTPFVSIWIRESTFDAGEGTREA